MAKMEELLLCPQCELYHACNQQEGVGTVHEGREKPRPLQRDEVLYEEGDTFAAVFAVRSGALKSIAKMPDGTERITGFYLPGEIVGAEGLSNGQYQRTVMAIQESHVCRFVEEAFTSEEPNYGKVQRGLLVSMSHQIKNEQWSGLMAAHRAEQRVAIFLYMLSIRFETHGLPAFEFRLPMSREEIAGYLGLAVETISRSFQKLRNNDIIQVSGRHLMLNDRDALQKFC